MNVLPSTSVNVAPRAEAATTGKVIASGRATAAAIRSPISRERGPGTSVFSSITRVAATEAAYRTDPALSRSGLPNRHVS